jgi:hypothetical protein
MDDRALRPQLTGRERDRADEARLQLDRDRSEPASSFEWIAQPITVSRTVVTMPPWTAAEGVVVLLARLVGEDDVPGRDEDRMEADECGDGRRRQEAVPIRCSASSPVRPSAWRAASIGVVPADRAGAGHVASFERRARFDLLPTLDESVSKCNYVDMTADWTRDNCAVGNTLSVIGERWTLLVLREAFLGCAASSSSSGTRAWPEHPQRPPEHARRARDPAPRALPGAAAAVRVPPDRGGLDLYPVLISMMDWGAKHAGGKAMTLTHKSCGAEVLPHLACPECGEHVEARDMRAQPREALRESA